MTKIKNKLAYPLKNPVVQDYFVGTDSENAGKTVSFSFENTAALMNVLNGNMIIDYLFSTNPDIAGEVLVDGKFLTNDNVTNVNDVDKFYVNRNTHSGTDMQQLFEFIKSNNDSFVFRFTDKANSQSIAYFSITDVQEFPAYFVFDVSIKIDSFDSFDLQNMQLYTIQFDFNTALDVDVSGKLDKGGYEGTAKDLDDKINNIQNINVIQFDAGFSLEAGLFIGNIGTLYNVDGTDCEITAFQSIPIPLASAGMKRFYRIVLVDDNTMVRIDGEEDTDNPAVPAIPENAIDYTIILVDDSEVGDAVPPVSGGDFITKIEKLNISQEISLGGSAIFLPGPSANITVTGGTTDIHYVSTPSNSYLYAGKKLTLKNGTGHNVTIHHLGTGSAFMFRFPEGTDFIWKPNETIEFSLKITGTNTGFYDYIGIGLSKEYVDAQDAATLTASKAYTDSIQYLRISATNKTGTTIPKGSVVYINGAQGSNPTMALSLGDTSDITSQVVGITSVAVVNNASGFVYTNGLIENLNTSTFNEGDVLFLSPTVPGGLTSTVPVSPNRVVVVGTCIRQHATQGKILIEIHTTFRLDRLKDVSVDGATTNQLLYKDADGNWKAKTVVAGDVDAYTKAETDAKDTATLNAAKTYSDGLVVGLLDDRGNYNPNTNINQYPTSGGSGTAGAVLKGDLWTISGLGLGVSTSIGSQTVTDGDVVRALANAPGQTDANWVITENNFGYTAENQANKKTTMTGNELSNTSYLTSKAVKDYVDTSSEIRVAVNDANYTITGATNQLIAYTAITADRTVTLPQGNTANQRIWITDESGLCSNVRRIIVAPFAGDSIGGDSFAVINFPNGSGYLESNGSGKWNIISTTSVQFSAGVNTMPTITDNGNGSITVGTGVYAIFANTGGQGRPKAYQVAGGTFTLVDNSQNFIYAEYNTTTGVVTVQQTTTETPLNDITQIKIYAAYRQGTTLHPRTFDSWGIALVNKINRSIERTQRVRVEEGGLVLGETASPAARTVTITSGVSWVGANEQALTAVTSAANTCYSIYPVAGVYQTNVVITQYDNTQYSDGTNLQTLSNGKYGTRFIYRSIGTDNDMAIVVGTTNGTLGEAQAAVPPTNLPTFLRHMTLVGRIIILKSASSATQIDSVNTLAFAQAGLTDHENLNNMLGGDGTGHYHLTLAQHTLLTKPPGSILKTRKDVTGTTYTLLAADVDKILYTTNAAGCAITVPAGLTTLQEYEVLQYTTGAVTFVTSGTTLKYQDYEIAATGQINSRVTISWIDTEIYQLMGQLSMI